MEINIAKSEDYVAVIAPASGVKNSAGALDIAASIKLQKQIEQLFIDSGFKCLHVQDQFSDEQRLPYFSHARQNRLSTMEEVLRDPKVKILVALRGGYGSGQLVFDLMRMKMPCPKILIGFSDITFMHALFNQIYALPSIHGSVKPELADSMTHMLRQLKGEDANFQLTPINLLAYNIEALEGVTTGGNLTILSNLLGTSLSLDTKNKILIIEDVAEPGYRLHRYLLHLHNANIFSQVKAVIFGTFTGKYNDMWSAVEAFSQEYLLHVPVFRTYEIGHDDANKPFTLGAMAFIDNNILKIKSPFRLV